MTVTNTIAYYGTKLITFNVKNAMSVALIVESNKGAKHSEKLQPCL